MQKTKRSRRGQIPFHSTVHICSVKFGVAASTVVFAYIFKQGKEKVLFPKNKTQKLFSSPEVVYLGNLNFYLQTQTQGTAPL